jgi:hypothetical protein
MHIIGVGASFVRRLAAEINVGAFLGSGATVHFGSRPVMVGLACDIKFLPLQTRVMRSFRVTLQFHTYLCGLSHRTGVNELMAHGNGEGKGRGESGKSGNGFRNLLPYWFCFLLILGRLKTLWHSHG